jgi:hypothetical protein
MSIPLVVAAALCVAISAAHSYLGERYLLIRLFRRENLPTLFGSDDFTKRTLRFAWHVTSVAWLGLASILLLAARTANGAAGGALERTAILRAVAGTFLASALLSFVGSRGRHYSWIVFLAIALLAGLAP